MWKQGVMNFKENNEQHMEESVERKGMGVVIILESVYQGNGLTEAEATEWESISACYTSDRGLIARKYKEQVKVANKYFKRCPKPLAIREIQAKMTLRFYLTLVRISNIRKQLKKCSWECWEVEPLFPVGGIANCCSLSWKSPCIILKN